MTPPPAARASCPDSPSILCDFLWEEFAADAEHATAAGDMAEARACWRTAEALCASFAPDDPRRAATLTGLGALAARSGQKREARARLDEALDAWSRAPDWIGRMAVTLKARNAKLHMRLETKHRASLENLARVQHERFAAAGRGAALANRALLALDEGDDHAACLWLGKAMTLRATGISHRDIAIGWIGERLAPLLAAAGNSEEARRIALKAAEIAADPVPLGRERMRQKNFIRMSDERRLTAAVNYAPVLREIS